jgi:hypothetical protein
MPTGAIGATGRRGAPGHERCFRRSVLGDGPPRGTTVEVPPFAPPTPPYARPREGRPEVAKTPPAGFGVIPRKRDCPTFSQTAMGEGPPQRNIDNHANNLTSNQATL